MLSVGDHWKIAFGSHCIWTSSAAYHAYHERQAKLVRHDIVKDRVDRCGHVIENARHVGHQKIEELHPRTVWRDVVLRISAVYGEQSLHVKRCPANEERDNHGDCNSS